MVSSVPFCSMVAVPPRSPAALGFGPQARPQSPMLHVSVSEVADQRPERFAGASARKAGAQVSPNKIAVSARVPDRMRYEISGSSTRWGPLLRRDRHGAPGQAHRPELRMLATSGAG